MSQYRYIAIMAGVCSLASIIAVFSFDALLGVLASCAGVAAFIAGRAAGLEDPDPNTTEEPEK